MFSCWCCRLPTAHYLVLWRFSDVRSLWNCCNGRSDIWVITRNKHCIVYIIGLFVSAWTRKTLHSVGCDIIVLLKHQWSKDVGEILHTRAWECILYYSCPKPCAGLAYLFAYSRYQVPGPRLNIKTVLSTYGDFHVKDKTAVRTSYL